MAQKDEREVARGRAEAKYRFFLHAGVYAAVMVLLVIINLVTSPGEFWFIWPLIGWGFAVALHGVRVYLLADKDVIVDALTERELRHLQANKTFGRPQDTAE
jgi:hypothetical protein